MRNEIFQKIRNNRHKFYAEMTTINNPSQLQESGSLSSTIPEEPLLKIHEFGFNQKIKPLVNNFKVLVSFLKKSLMPLHIILSKNKALLDNGYSRLLDKFDTKTETLKLQMADFIMALFSDEEFEIANHQGELKLQLSTVPSHMKGRQNSYKKEVIFYLASKPGMLWGKIQQQPLFQHEGISNILIKKTDAIHLPQLISNFKRMVKQIIHSIYFVHLQAKDVYFIIRSNATNRSKKWVWAKTE